MEILCWILALIWVSGWIKELAWVHSTMERHGIEYPDDAVKYAMPVVLFLAWPYFYFYGKTR
jgi:hypothetical protein